MEHKWVQQIFWHHHKIDQRELYKTGGSWYHWWSLLINFFTQGEKSEQDVNEKKFVKYYLAVTTVFCIRFISVNIFLLLVGIYVVTQKHFGNFHMEVDRSFDPIEVAVVEMTLWIIFSLMCLSFFLVLYLKPSTFRTLHLGDECEVWYAIGASILGARCLIFVVQFTTMLLDGFHCIDSYDLIGRDNYTFGYVFIKMSVDAYQTYTFAILPFPQPWSAVFTCMELLKQELRLHSCSDRITTNPLQTWIITLVSFVLVVVYTTLLLLPSMYLEGSVRNRYRKTVLQAKAEGSKRELVNFLSTDVRAPLRSMLHGVNIIDFVEMAGHNTQPLLNDINKHTHTVNDIADDLLLLVRIQEKRYTSRFSRVHDLRAMFEKMVQAVLQRRFADVGPAVKTNDSVPIGERAPTTANISSRARECSIYTAVPSIELNVDEKCLLAVLRHLLIFITHEPREAGEEETDGRQSLSATHPECVPRVDMELTAKIDVVTGIFSPKAAKRNASRSPPSSAGETKQVLCVTLSGDKTILKEWNDQRRVHEATTAYICNSIASSCGGTFTSKGFSYTLVMPCRTPDASSMSDVEDPVELEPKADDASAGDSVAVSVQTNARSMGTLQTRAITMVGDTNRDPDRANLDAKIINSSEMQARFKRNRVCIIVDDTVLESVITSAITTLRLQEGLSILHELQKGDYVPVAKLTFVTSYELCVELRRRHYTGLIVLFSGSINYLDDTQIANLDYSLPLPASDAQLSLFVNWLVDIYEKENKSSAKAAAAAGKQDATTAKFSSLGSAFRQRPNRRRPSHSAITTKGEVSHPLPMLSLFATLYKHPVLRLVRRAARGVVRKCLAYSNSKETWFLVSRLPPGTVESYFRWKVLNPSQSWSHHSVEIFMTCVPRMMIQVVYETWYLQSPLIGTIPGLINFTIILSKSLIYKYIIKPVNGSVALYWFVAGCLALLYFVYAIAGGLMQPAATQTGLTLSQFLGTVFYGNRYGGGYLYSQIMTAAFARLYAMYLYYPLSIIDVILVAFRSSQLVWLVLRTLCTQQMCEYIQLVYIQLALLNIIFLANMEDTYRREFKTAHEHILARAFLDQCLDICQHDIRKPLEFLLQRQKDLMQVAVHSAYIRAYTVDRNMLSKFEPLHQSRAMLSEMVHELVYGRNYLSESTKAPVHSVMEAIQLNRGVSTVISNLSSAAADVQVKIFSEIDNKLAVIRVDWRMLSMILTNLVSAALRNIRDFCIETPRNKDVVNYIKIKIVAVESEAKLPFVHPRLMLINVCDSSNAAAKAVEGAIAASKARATAAIAAVQTRGSDVGAQQFAFSSHFTEQRDQLTSQYGRSVCEQLVLKLSPTPVFQTIAVESLLRTVQRFTFPYHLTPQTRRAEDHIKAETSLPYQTVSTCVPLYLSDYLRIVCPAVRPGEKVINHRNIVYFSGAIAEKRQDTIRLIKKFEHLGWNCLVKYIVSIPSMNSVSKADCVLIDHQVEGQDGVNISDTVLKLRVCGFNGVVAVVLQEGLRACDLIRDEISKSAADVDLIITGPIREQNIQALTVAVEKKFIKIALNMNSS